MKVFLSHARKDDRLARELGDSLQQEGFSVWDSQHQIVPGENWARKVAKGLDDSELMVVLITPRSSESDSLRRDIQFAIGSEKFENRLFTVLVGPTMTAGKDVPWILLELPHRQVESAKEFAQVARDIQQMSHAHA